MNASMSSVTRMQSIFIPSNLAPVTLTREKLMLSSFALKRLTASNAPNSFGIPRITSSKVIPYVEITDIDANFPVVEIGPRQSS